MDFVFLYHYLYLSVNQIEKLFFFEINLLDVYGSMPISHFICNKILQAVEIPPQFSIAFFCFQNNPGTTK